MTIEVGNIRFKKRTAPPSHLPDELEVIGFWDDTNGGGVKLKDDSGNVYQLSYAKFLEYYEVE